MPSRGIWEIMDIIKTSDLTINERIRKYRKQKKMSQKQVAAALDMNYTTYSQMEREAKNISAQMLVNIAYVLGVKAELLFYGENPIEPDFPAPNPLVVQDPEKPVFPVPIPIGVEDPGKFVPTAILKYKTPDFEITHEEKQIIKIFKNATEKQKQQIREFMKQFQ